LGNKLYLLLSEYRK